MRPHRLEMAAFGPYAGTQVLDFDSLGERRMFLVHGPTGAGKTSVLDAICYALYGDASGTEREARGMRSQYAAPEEATRVTLDFSLGPQRRFRVTRRPAYERPKKSGEGTTKVPGDAWLWESDATGPEARSLAVGDRKVTDAVVALLGFASEQFRQVVVLPQGEFRRFLLAGHNERQEILGALFDTRTYGRVEDALAQAAKEVATARKRREGDIELVLHQVAAAPFAAEGTGDEATAVTAGPSRVDDVVARRDALAARVGVATSELHAARGHAEDARAALERGRRLDALAKDDATAAAARATAEHAVTERRAVHETAQRDLAAERARDAEREASREEERRLRELAKRGAALDSARREVELAAGAADAGTAGRARADAAVADADAATEAARDEEKRTGALSAELAAHEQSLARCEEQRELRDQLETMRNKSYPDAVAAAKTAKAARADAAKRLAKAQDALAELEQAWEAGQAFLLAKTLKEGEPCPVCGATHHPGKKRVRAEPPPHKRLEAKREDVRKLERAVEEATELVARHEKEAERTLGEGKQLAKTLGPLAHRPPAELADAVLAARAARDAARDATTRLPTLTARIETARAARARRGEEQQAATAVERKAAAELAAARERLAERAAEVPDALRADGAIASAQDRAAERTRALTLAFELAQERAARADRELADALARADAARTQAAEARRRHDDAAAGHLDVSALEAAARFADAAREDTARRVTQLEGAVQQHEAWIAQLVDLERQRAELDARYAVVGTLDDVANGRNAFGLRFESYVLASRLDDVLAAATVRLAKLTRGRYRLQRRATRADKRKSEGLDLEVHDEHTGVARDAATLSGGESFLASLALALGLADVVERYAGNVHLDTLFIDEGFGSLDPDALEQALTALLALRADGRLVGIISHVEELKTRFADARLEVTPGIRGSTARFVVG